MKYKLSLPLPKFKIGDEFHINGKGNLVHTDTGTLVYSRNELKKYPIILQDWFDEIPEQPKSLDDLKDGDEWFFINYDCTHGKVSQTDNLMCLPALKELGLAFLTEQEGRKELARRKAEQVLLRDTKGFKPNWEKATYPKRFIVGYSYATGTLLAIEAFGCVNYGGLYFATEEDAEASIKAHEKEWKVYLEVKEDNA